MSSNLESKFQNELIKELEKLFPDAIIEKLKPIRHTGIPDLLILNGNKWATLECKRRKNSKKRPLQEYWVNKMNEMSFSRFICPENKEVVLNEIQRALRP